MGGAIRVGTSSRNLTLKGKQEGIERIGERFRVMKTFQARVILMFPVGVSCLAELISLCFLFVLRFENGLESPPHLTIRTGYTIVEFILVSKVRTPCQFFQAVVQYLNLRLL